MNLDRLQKELLAAARANPPAEHVPLAFEQRVLAHLRSRPAADLSALWARALWRAAIPCVAVMAVVLAFSLVPTNKPEAANEQDLSQAFEQTLLASSATTVEEIW